MKILLLGDFTRPVYHPFEGVYRLLKAALEREGHTVDGSEDRSLLDDDRLSFYDLILSYFDAPGGVLGRDAVGALERFMASGKGLVAVHCAVLSEDPELHRLLGAKFLNHPPYQMLRVQTKDDAHPITDGVKAFDIQDELYIMEPLVPDERHVFLECSLDGVVQPVAWTRNVGQGRLVYHALGHSESSFSNPSFMKLMVNSLHWAGGSN